MATYGLETRRLHPSGLKSSKLQAPSDERREGTGMMDQNRKAGKLVGENRVT